MSAKNGYQRTCKSVWIPMFSLLAFAPGLQAGGVAKAPEGALLAVRAGEAGLTAREPGWEILIDWLLQRMLDRIDHNHPGMFYDAPEGMIVVAQAYDNNGLPDMTGEEVDAFLGLLDEAEDALKDAPAGFPAATKVMFEQKIKLMRAEAEAQQ